MSIHYQFIHPTRTQGGANGSNNHFTSIDVTYDLCFPLRSVGTLFQQNNGRLLSGNDDINYWKFDRLNR